MAARTSQSLPKLSLESDRIFGEAEFSRGIVRDMPRSSIPVGAVYDAVDFLVDKPGVAYKRGGTVYRGGTLGSDLGGVGFVAAPEFPNGTKVIGLGADNNVYDLSAGTNAGVLGITTVDNPHLWVDRLIVTSADGITQPKKITSPGPQGAGVVTIAPWGGGPPPGRLATVHLSRVVLANSAAQPHRIWFSPVPNPEAAWNTNAAYIDTNHSITGICPCQGVLLVFSGGHTERIIGDVIPGEVGENMSVAPVGEVGCSDARSIAPWRGNVVFAGQGGVWVTNGVGFDSLIEKEDGSGIATYWRDLYDITATNNGIIAGGVYGRDFYILCLSFGSGIVDTLVCYLPRKAWTRLSNVGVRSFANAFMGRDELYGATIAQNPGNRVIRFSSVFNPDTDNMVDANGYAVQPQIEFRMIGEGIGLKAHGHGHLTYDMRNTTGSPTMSVDTALGIEGGLYFPVQEGSPMQKTSGVTRRRFIVNRDGQTLNLRLIQTGPSSETELYAVEQEVRPYNVTADGN